MADKLDLVSKLPAEERKQAEWALRSISPDDAKYRRTSQKLADYLSADAEWRACALVQNVLLETRVEFGQAEQRHLDEVIAALDKISPLNISLLEDEITQHDQLAVIEELGRFVSEETKALLHPGTTSYDILDTARSYMFKRAWVEVIRPEVIKAIEKLCELAQKSMYVLQVGRTHLQNTSPVPFGLTLALNAARLANRVELCDGYFADLRGKVSGIVGTGASIDMVVGEGKSLYFEEAVLNKLGLKPDYTATQIVQKERLADVGHGITTLMLVLADFADDIRKLYGSAIGEVTSRDNAARLGGSSADATKNNPVHWENIIGNSPTVEGSMRILYSLIATDFQRDLVGSKPSRYQPQAMMVECYEAFTRLNRRCLSQLSINEDRMAENLRPVKENPSEAMVAILRGAGWIHSEYGVGHEFVRKIGILAQQQRKPLLAVAMEDAEFRALYEKLPKNKQNVLQGQLEKYTGSSAERTRMNISYALEVCGKK